MVQKRTGRALALRVAGRGSRRYGADEVVITWRQHQAPQRATFSNDAPLRWFYAPPARRHAVTRATPAAPPGAATACCAVPVHGSPGARRPAVG